MSMLTSCASRMPPPQVVGYARLYRFSHAEYDQLSARLQQVRRPQGCSGGPAAVLWGCSLV